MNTTTSNPEIYELNLPIRLGQFLKLADVVENGAQARELILSQMVKVNGIVETRRAHELTHGDIITVGHGDKSLHLQVVNWEI